MEIPSGASTIRKCSPQVSSLFVQVEFLTPSQHHLLILTSDLEAFIDLLKDYADVVTITKIDRSRRIVCLRLENLDVLEELIHSPLVLFVEKADRLAREEVSIRDYDRGLNKTNLLLARLPHLRGEGMVISLKENLFDPSDIDIRSQLVAPVPNTLISAHATTMATILVGRGNTSSDGRGLAPDAGLSHASFLDIFPDEAIYFEQHQITVQNHSYGVEIENYYGLEAAAYDQQTRLNPFLLHVFSAGNAGQQAASSGLYKDVPGWANLTGNFKMAKNVLTIGAVDSFGLTPSQSSRGPAFDGRIKPELVAMGHRGSSESAATVSGTAVLLQQAFKERHLALPPAALLKTILINSAEDIGDAGIDFTTGYGSLNAYEAVRTVMDGRYLTDTLRRDDSIRFNLEIPVRTKSVKVTLGWDDPAADINAGEALINDLDLMIIDPQSGVWFPWVLNSFPHPDSLMQPPLRKRDHLNNIEQITIEQPVSGNYTLVVSASRLSTDEQPLYLSFQIDTAQAFVWTSPGPDEKMEAGQKSTVRWHQNFETKYGQLEYSLDDGHHWSLIDSLVVLDHESYSWKFPLIFSQVQLRMKIGDLVFDSESFSISPKTDMAVAFDCEKQVMLTWNPVPEAVEYKVYQYGGRDMELVSITMDTQMVVEKEWSVSPHFAVSALNDQQLEGIRSLTINYEDQGSFCYLIAFFAYLEDERAILDLTLSSSFQIKQIRIEKEINHQFVTIGQAEDLSLLNHQFVDLHLKQGINIYRAVIMLNEGTEIVSDLSSIYFRGKNQALVFPNPATKDESISILINDPHPAKLHLFNSLGQYLSSIHIFTGYGEFLLDPLPAGIYFYQIEKENSALITGRFLVR